MSLVFDGPAHPYGLDPFSAIALLPLAWWAFDRYVRRKRSTWVLPAIAIGLFAFVNGIRLWDQWRIRHLPPDAVHVTAGVIEESWHIESRTRDWSQRSLSYRTTVSEGFDVAGLRFQWNVADSYSPATFSNAQEPRLAFPKGTPVEVTWFVDAATNDERRILRLRLGGTAAGAAKGDALATFLARFSAAFAAGDTGALDAMTRYPVAFGGHALARDRSATVWIALRMPALQTCLALAVAERHGDDAAEVACDGTVFAFRKEADGGWRFTGIPRTR